jgi:hypothetical protein
VSIAQQIATPTPSSRTRRFSTPLQAAPSPRPAYAVARLLALIGVTALGVAFVAGTIAIVIMMLASSLGG